jgi:mRNA interferase RelE/StbE
VEHSCAKRFEKIDNSVKAKIFKFLEKDSILLDPRSSGKQLKYKFGGYWRYRVDNFRVIVEIKDNVLIVVVVAVGKRDEIYHD